MNESQEHYDGFLKEVKRIRNIQTEQNKPGIDMENQLTEDIKDNFLAALDETVLFLKPEDSDSTDLDETFKSELDAHAISFLYRAWAFYIAENKQRTADSKHLKTVDDLAHDFLLTSCGHGAGFWEKSESDWLYTGSILEKIANNYFYHGFSIMDNGDGLLTGG